MTEKYKELIEKIKAQCNTYDELGLKEAKTNFLGVIQDRIRDNKLLDFAETFVEEFKPSSSVMFYYIYNNKNFKRVEELRNLLFDIVPTKGYAKEVVIDYKYMYSSCVRKAIEICDDKSTLEPSEMKALEELCGFMYYRNIKVDLSSEVYRKAYISIAMDALKLNEKVLAEKCDAQTNLHVFKNAYKYFGELESDSWAHNGYRIVDVGNEEEIKAFKSAENYQKLMQWAKQEFGEEFKEDMREAESEIYAEIEALGANKA